MSLSALSAYQSRARGEQLQTEEEGESRGITRCPCSKNDTRSGGSDIKEIKFTDFCEDAHAVGVKLCGRCAFWRKLMDHNEPRLKLASDSPLE